MVSDRGFTHSSPFFITGKYKILDRFFPLLSKEGD